MRLKTKARYVILPKAGNTPEECEDAIYLSSNGAKVAIADGATESSFSREWAQMLVEGFGKSRSKVATDNFMTHLNSWQAEWKKIVDTKDLPWYAEEKVRQGAFSTLLGIRFDLKKSQWQGIGIGDCCLFQFREEKLQCTFPVSSAEEFGNNPYLVSSNQASNKNISEHFKETTGSIQEGDFFILASDALAHWLFRNIEDGEKLEKFRALLRGHSKKDYQKNFSNWLNYQREQKEIKNDDVVFCLIEIKSHGASKR